MSSDRFHDLLSRFLDDELNPAELDELAHLAASREEYLEELRWQLELADRLSLYEDESRDEQAFFQALETRLEAEASSERFVDRVVEEALRAEGAPAAERTAHPAHRSRRRRRALVATIAATLALVLGVFLLRPQSESDLPEKRVARESQRPAEERPIESRGEAPASPAGGGVALLARSADAKWAQNPPADASGNLAPGWLRLEEGLVQIDFFSGAHVLLRGPAELEIRSAREAFLKSGDATCFVSELGRGFRIVTEKMEVIDLGTEYGLSVGDGREPEVHVIDGKVAVREPKQGKSVEVVERQAVQFGNRGVTATDFAPRKFPRPEEIVQLQRAHARDRLESWRRFAERLSADWSVLLHYTCDAEPATGLSLTNRSRSESRGSDGVVIGCQVGRGRWEGKSSIGFRHSTDRVLLKLPGEHSELTFLAWVRIDALTHPVAPLVLTEEPRRWNLYGSLSETERAEATRRWERSLLHSVRWEIDNQGRLHFNISFRNETRPGGLEWETHVTPEPVIHSSDWGQWLCLAVTYDVGRKEARHYVNGRCVSAHPLRRPCPLLLDYLELGNLSTLAEAEKKRLDRYRFYGAIDEVLLADRVFSEGEILEIWRIGRP